MKTKQSIFETPVSLKIFKRVKESKVGEVIKVKLDIIGNDLHNPNEPFEISLVVCRNYGWVDQAKGKCLKKNNKVVFDPDKKRFYRRNAPKRTIRFPNQKQIIDKILLRLRYVCR
jgi:hypothetical protein